MNSDDFDNRKAEMYNLIKSTTALMENEIDKSISIEDKVI